MNDDDSLPHITHKGGCHCQAVRFSVRAPAVLQVLECNCSVCSKSAFLHLIVKAEDFSLLQGANMLTHYTFNTGVADHQFCRVCGIKSFYIPRSHPNGYSVNARCLDSDTVSSVEIQQFDGLRWEDSIGSLRS